MKDFAVSAHPIDGTKVLQRQRVVRRVKTKSAQHSLLMPALFLLLIISILFYVWTRVQVVQYGYKISAALREKEAAVIAHNERTLELATLCSAQRMEKRAREELGMDTPRKDQLIILP